MKILVCYFSQVRLLCLLLVVLHFLQNVGVLDVVRQWIYQSVVLVSRQLQTVVLTEGFFLELVVSFLYFV